jgi:hypothetical protein
MLGIVSPVVFVGAKVEMESVRAKVRYRAGVVHGFWGRLCLEVDSRARKKKNESSEYVDKVGTHMSNMCWTFLLGLVFPNISLANMWSRGCTSVEDVYGCLATIWQAEWVSTYMQDASMMTGVRQ